jgi:histidinol-phosphate aminotransferase
MTKDYALAGLRLGYSVASPEITKMLASLQPDWSVNSLAQAAGIVSLADNDYLISARQTIEDIKMYLISELESQGFIVPVTNVNFVLVETNDAHKLRTQLLSKGIVVRDCTSFGLPNYIRIGIRKLQDCEKLVLSMQELIDVGFEY